MIKVNKTDLRKSLKECVVAPNAAGPVTIMLEVGDHKYLMQRAVELARLAISSPTPDQQVSYLKTAITILGIAKHDLSQHCQPLETVIETMTGEGPVVRKDL